MPNEGLTRIQLDHMQCGTPGCTSTHGEFCLHGRCHLDAPSWPWYEAGVLTLRCATCNRVVSRIKVAA
jgi:hypothetical protein